MNRFISKFRVSQGEAINRCYSVASSVERDIEYFSEFNINLDVVTNFRSSVNAYQSIANDQVSLNEQKTATELKNNLRTELTEKFRKLRVRVALVCGEKSLDYDCFRFDRIHDATDEDFVLVSETIITEAAKRLEKLQTLGFGETQLSELNIAKNKYQTALLDSAEKVKNRDVATFVRTEAGNMLFEDFRKLCEIGKLIWQNKSDAHYNDYVFIDVVSNKPDTEDEAVDDDTGVEDEVLFES